MYIDKHARHKRLSGLRNEGVEKHLLAFTDRDLHVACACRSKAVTANAALSKEREIHLQ